MLNRIKCDNCKLYDNLHYKGDYHTGYGNLDVILECGYCSNSLWHTIPSYIPIEQMEKYMYKLGVTIYERNTLNDRKN